MGGHQRRHYKGTDARDAIENRRPGEARAGKVKGLILKDGNALVRREADCPDRRTQCAHGISDQPRQQKDSYDLFKGSIQFHIGQ